MTWYTQQLFLQPGEASIAPALSLPGAKGHLFQIPPIHSATQTVQDGVLFQTSATIPLTRTLPPRLETPPQGPLVLRELSEGGSDSASWFGHDALHWDSMAIPDDSSYPLHDLDQLFLGAPAGWQSEAPPVGVLACFRDIAIRTSSDIAYFCCHMWGGDIVISYAWIWYGRTGVTRFYRASVDTDGHGHEINTFYTDVLGVVIHDGMARRFVANADVLTMVLLEFGVLIKDGFFESHTRAFSWERYSVG